MVAKQSYAVGQGAAGKMSLTLTEQTWEAWMMEEETVALHWDKTGLTYNKNK